MASPIQKHSVESTPHSTIERGEITVGNGIASYRKETPYEASKKLTVIAATGLCSNLASLELESTIFSQSGFTVVSVGHRHHETGHPIRKNADDIEAAAELLSDSERFHLTGISMGAVSTVVAAQRMKGRVESANLVAMAMLTPIRFRRAYWLAYEARKEAFRKGGNFNSSAIDGLRATSGRVLTAASETGKLAIGNIHPRVKDLVRDKVDVHIISPVRDGFFDPYEQRDVARNISVKSHTIFTEGTAGHGSLAYHPGLTRMIIGNIDPTATVAVEHQDVA